MANQDVVAAQKMGVSCLATKKGLDFGPCSQLESVDPLRQDTHVNMVLRDVRCLELLDASFSSIFCFVAEVRVSLK